MREEQYYPTICSPPPLGLSPLSAAFSSLCWAHVLSHSFSTPPHGAFSLLTL